MMNKYIVNNQEISSIYPVSKGQDIYGIYTGYI